MKVSDHIAKFLLSKKVEAVFGVTGGAAVHLFDSADRMGIECIFTHHEQAAAFAAGAYARLKGFGVCFTTTGPGGTNAVTGIASAWLDSVPCFFIGGQVRSHHLKPPSIRQQGAQEVDNFSIIRPIVKHAQILKSADEIEFVLEECYRIAHEGRPGPIYLEIPLEKQWTEVSHNAPKFKSIDKPRKMTNSTEEQLLTLLKKLQSARRPLLLVGHGVRLAKADSEIDEFLSKSGIPSMATWNAIDLMSKSRVFLGSPGMFGTQEAYSAIQECDFLCCIGTHLPIPVTTANIETFAPQAEIGLVNIDANEIAHQRVPIHYPLQMDAKLFLQRALDVNLNVENSWIDRCYEFKKHFSIEHKDFTGIDVDSYFATRTILERAPFETVFVVDGGGTIVQIAFQTLQAVEKQRILIDAGLCAMGSGLPHAVGAAVAKKAHTIVCFCGDGSFQFNIHELQTIFHHRLNIKLFVFNNNGYLSIRNTQHDYLDAHYIGSSQEGGLSVPNIQEVAKAYSIPTLKIENAEDFPEVCSAVFRREGPEVIEVVVSSKQKILPYAVTNWPFALQTT